MWKQHVELLRCPKTGKRLELEALKTAESGEILDGQLREPESGNTYPIVSGIPRFVEASNYTNNFGFQWNLHRLTQHDDHSLLNASRERFWKETRWAKRLSGQLIVEAGSGSGRFTKFPVEAGATLVSFDYSNAVEANYAKNGHYQNLLIVQGNLFEPPLEKKRFDKVFCFGVLQHTPNPKKAFLSLSSLLKPKGDLAADIYLKSFLNYRLNPVYYVRPLTRNQDPEKLYGRVKRHVDRMWPVVQKLRQIPRLGSQISRRVLMVADHSSQFPEASEETLKQWAYLDTFDWFSPRYDSPETVEGFRKWFEEAGYQKIDVGRGYNGVEGRGKMSGRTAGKPGGANKRRAAKSTTIDSTPTA